MTSGRRTVQCHNLDGFSRLAVRACALASIALALLAAGCGGPPASMGGRGGLSGAGAVTGTAGPDAGDMTGTGGLTGTGDVFPDASPVPSTGSFSWSANGGQTFATVGWYYYATSNGSSGGMLAIGADFALTGIPCNLYANFASPFPPVGTYPIGDWSQQQTIGTGTFYGNCSNLPQLAGFEGDQSVGGQVTLTKAAPGDIEGSFTMITIPGISTGSSFTVGPDGGWEQNTYAGEFAVTGWDFPTNCLSANMSGFDWNVSNPCPHDGGPACYATCTLNGAQYVGCVTGSTIGTQCYGSCSECP
jgi:hypothetical protein